MSGTEASSSKHRSERMSSLEGCKRYTNVRIELEGYRVGEYCGHLRSCGQSSPSKHRRACDSHPWNAGMLVGKRKNTVVFRYSLDLVKLFLNSNSTISDKL